MKDGLLDITYIMPCLKMGELRSTIKILEDSHPNTYRHKQAGILGKYIEYQDSFSFMWVQPADAQNLWLTKESGKE